MTDWLMQHGHWGFISLAFGVFALGLLIDGLQPLLAERRLRRELLAQMHRQRAKEQS